LFWRSNDDWFVCNRAQCATRRDHDASRRERKDQFLHRLPPGDRRHGDDPARDRDVRRDARGGIERRRSHFQRNDSRNCGRNRNGDLGAAHDMDVGTAGPAEVVMATTSIVSGASVSITSGTLTEGNA
jgi:hypothetical protein